MKGAAKWKSIWRGRGGVAWLSKEAGLRGREHLHLANPWPKFKQNKAKCQSTTQGQRRRRRLPGCRECRQVGRWAGGRNWQAGRSSSGTGVRQLCDYLTVAKSWAQFFIWMLYTQGKWASEESGLVGWQGKRIWQIGERVEAIFETTLAFILNNNKMISVLCCFSLARYIPCVAQLKAYNIFADVISNVLKIDKYRDLTYRHLCI